MNPTAGEHSVYPWLAVSLGLHLALLSVAKLELATALPEPKAPLLLRIERVGAPEGGPQSSPSLPAPALSAGGRQPSPAEWEGREQAASPAAVGESGADASSVPDRAAERSRLTQARYEEFLAARFERYKRYPSSALRRGIEGEALVRLVIARDGDLLASELTSASGSDILDREALAMIARARPLPGVPEDMTGESFEFELPVSFRLRPN